jgi:hypothetical protein
LRVLQSVPRSAVISVVLCDHRQARGTHGTAHTHHAGRYAWNTWTALRCLGNHLTLVTS